MFSLWKNKTSKLSEKSCTKKVAAWQKKKKKKLKNETFFFSEIALELEDLLERFRDF